MGFRFPLATLLRLREIAEQREERLLGQILNQMAQSRQTLIDLDLKRCDLAAQRELASQQSTSASEIQGIYGQMHEIDNLLLAGREHLAKLATLREQQMKIYEAAHRDKELLSGIKKDQLETFQKEQSRQEQNAMDDNFSSRRRTF